MEIERRFLMNPEAFKAAHPYYAQCGQGIAQGYLSTEPVVRIRVPLIMTEHSHGVLTIKGKGLLSREEIEMEIPLAKAKDALRLCPAILRKTRYSLHVGDTLWEVDEFHGIHTCLWIAEVELTSESQAFEKPAWVTREITLDPKYTNVSLAQKIPVHVE